jgi:hypothetical protein
MMDRCDNRNNMNHNVRRLLCQHYKVGCGQILVAYLDEQLERPARVCGRDRQCAREYVDVYLAALLYGDSGVTDAEKNSMAGSPDEPFAKLRAQKRGPAPPP